jgi:predicted protein tyrosine phosphatase
MAKDRLKALIARLYHPVPGQRQVFAVGRAEAEQLPALATVAVISITAPGKPDAKLAKFSHVLRLSFADVDFNRNDLSERARKKLSDAFRIDQARAVHQFVDELPAEIASVVVHCEGGFSRSSAIALGLSVRYGHLARVPHANAANRSILEMIVRTGRP